MGNAGITIQAKDNNLDKSRREVANAVAKLQAKEIIRRGSPNKGGHYEIIKSE